METKFQTSFIPKKPVVMSGTSLSSNKPMSFLSFLGILIFVLTLFIAGGSFLYKTYVDSSIKNMKKTLESKKSTLDLRLIQEFVNLDERFASSKQLLSTHIAPSHLFSLLESLTLRSVRFTSLKYTVDADKKVHLDLEGEARSYSVVAAQAEAFTKERSFISPIFSNFDLDDKGNVKFSVKTDFDFNTLVYKADSTE